MKKILSLLLTFMVVVGLFVGCGEKQDKEASGSVSEGQVSDSEDNHDENNEEKPSGIKASISVQVEKKWQLYYQDAAQRVLADNPDATIDFIVTGCFDHLDVLDSTDVTNEDIADVFAIPADRIYGLTQNEALAEINAKEMAGHVGGFDDYDEGLGGNFKIDGRYLAFPMNIETLINFANKANAEASGIDLANTIEFTELNYQDMLVPVFNAWFGVAITNAADIELLGMDESGGLFTDMTKDFSELTQKQQDAFRALFNYWKAHDEAGTDLWDNDATWGYMDAEFTTGGKNAIRLEGPWSANGLSEKASKGEELEIFPINQVTVNGNPLAHWKGGWGLGVNARIEEDQDKMLLAQAMIEEIVNTEYAVDLFKATGKILENVDPAVYETSDLSDMDKKIVAAVMASYENAPARPLFTEWGSVWETWENGLLSWAAVKPATVEDAYAEVKASFEAMMANY
ncbi:carbohydrate ABC transporter substrate-binding protein [Vallitalea pronyensis]|uniref:Carbohydrate ABC transporter substrate-binding protein n=1 Tax=Vallitalea pronyensis TaxID=1348613 RepID=A0A8J8MMR2_9FIRM|nr:ABC transporter substrate-binding protein [Vallitalea pronyensis]QUI24354.1 carbohydrate ABC transporter substrate-binding protein [Vallitalea pronyensis]